MIQEILVNPDLTVAIFSHTKPIAHAFLGQIKRELEENPLLKSTYDDVLWADPVKEAPKWSGEDGIIIRRVGNPREATVEAHGLVDGQPISRHYDLLVYDDVVTERSVTTPDQIAKTTRMWELSDNLSTHKGARKWHAGTRYHHGDTYGIILERKALKPRIYPATDDGTLNGKPVFLSSKRWQEIKTSQRSTVSAQMLLNPVAGNEAIFLSEWFTPYEIYPSMLNVYILCDPSKGKRRTARGASADSDRTAIAVIGIDQASNKYLIDGYCHRMRLSERYHLIKQLHLKWSSFHGVQSVRVGYEQYGAQVDLEVIEEYQMRDGSYFELEELNFPREGLHSKKHRVERLEPDMKTGRFLMPGVVYHPEIPEPHRKRDFPESMKNRIARFSCQWKVWSEADNQKAGGKSEHQVGQIIYRPLMAPTRAQNYADSIRQPHRIVAPLRRINEDGEIYDLTRVFMEEARFFPFSPHDDLIDAAARIYDMEPCAPVAFESEDTEAVDEDCFAQEEA